VSTIRLLDGTVFDLLNPDYASLSLRNVVHGLAGAYRLGGQSPRRLTWAEHVTVGTRRLGTPAVAREIAQRHGLQRLQQALRETCEPTLGRLRQTFFVFAAPAFCLHDLTVLSHVGPVRKLVRLHVSRLAAARTVPIVQLEGQSAAAYANDYALAWERARRQKLLFGLRPSALPSPAEMDAHLLTAEVCAAVSVIDSALTAIAIAQAWESGGTAPVRLFDLAIGAVDFAFLEPEHAYLALLCSLPSEWR